MYVVFVVFSYFNTHQWIWEFYIGSVCKGS